VARLCEWCSNILIDHRPHQQFNIDKRLPIFVGGLRNLNQLKKASLESCPICLTVYRAACQHELVDLSHAQYYLAVSYSDSNTPIFYVEGRTVPFPPRWEFELTPLTKPTLAGYRRTASYDYAKDSGDPMVASLIHSWLSDCSAQHALCRRKEGVLYRPPRLIEITKHRIKLVKPKALVLSKYEAPYATLSHCWGTNPTFLTLTAQNSRRLHDQIHLHELPKTFQDAILLCQRLGLLYLWIDSLCVTQEGEGSEADWLLHITEMRNIYRNCFVNIAASRAANASQGLYTLIKPWRIDSMGDGSIPAGQFLLVHKTISKYGWEQAPLTNRGWVYVLPRSEHRCALTCCSPLWQLSGTIIVSSYNLLGA
jgi:hypothetical protein